MRQFRGSHHGHGVSLFIHCAIRYDIGMEEEQDKRRKGKARAEIVERGDEIYLTSHGGDLLRWSGRFAPTRRGS